MPMTQRRRSSLLAATALLLPLVASAAALADEPARRSYRMGFTPFPYDATPEAVAGTRRFVKAHGDIIAFHIEGVPWAECLGGQPFSPDLIRDWEGQRQATPDAGKVYLAISPGRGTLKEGEKSLPIPEALRGKPYDDPLLKRAYLAYCRRMVEFFRPDYLAIGIEVNEIYQAGPKVWGEYADLHRHVYRELKKEHPGLPIFASFTLHGMLNQKGEEREAMLAAFRQIMPQNDLVAVSFYPFIRGGTTDYKGGLSWLDGHFGGSGKPYAIVETGEAADRLRLPQSGQTIDGTPEKQAAYYEALLGFAGVHQTLFVISFLHRDYDALWEKIKVGAPEAFLAWRDCGLLDERGRPRPAFAVWKRHLDRTLVR
jgi:hypothetical protein